MSGGDDVSVAPGVKASVQMSATVDLYVHVRDMAGRPLAKAQVTVVGSSQKPIDTDEFGTAVFKGFAATQAPLVQALYTLRFGGNPIAIPFPGGAVALQDAFDPSPLDAPGTMPRELHFTMRISTRYALKRLFAWQNPQLREKLYIDGVSTGRFIKVHPKDDPSRNRIIRLKGALDYLDATRKELTGATKAVTAAQKQVTDAQKAVDKEQKAVAAEKKALEKKPDSKYHLKELEKKEKALADDQAALTKKQQTLNDASAALTRSEAGHGGSTHRSLMEYLSGIIDLQTELPDWIKYGIVHLCGLRYRPSSGCCYAPRDIVAGLRDKEIIEHEHPSSSALGEEAFAKQQRLFAREYLAIFRRDANLARDVAALVPAQRDRMLGKPLAKKTAPKKTDDLVTILERLARSAGPWSPVPPAPGAKDQKPGLAMEMYDLRCIAIATMQMWAKQTGDAAAAKDGAPPDDGEALGAIADRWFNGQQIPAVVWQRAASSTALLHDFYDAAWDHKPDQWNSPKLPKEWEKVFPSDRSSWLKLHSTTMQPYFTGAVCNDVASILARARGLSIGDNEFIMGMATATVRIGDKKKADDEKKKADDEKKKAAAAQAPAAGGGAPAPGDAATEPDIAQGGAAASSDAAAAAGTAGGAGGATEYVGLFRPRSPSEVKAGDILYWGRWEWADAASGEAHLVVPDHVLPLGAPPLPSDLPKGLVGGAQELVRTSGNFGAALAAGIKPIEKLEELAPTAGTVAYGMQHKRGKNPNTGRKKKGEEELVYSDYANRIVRAYVAGDAAVQKEGAAPDAPPGATVAHAGEPEPADEPNKPVNVKYQAFIYQHIGTVIGANAENIYFLETAAPIGVSTRSAALIADPRCFFGRVPASKNPPNLKWFIRRGNLIDRLDNG